MSLVSPIAAASARYPQVKAPRCDGTGLVAPPIAAAGELLALNRTYSAASKQIVAGEPIAALREEARLHLVRAAMSYTGEYRDVTFAASAVDSADIPLILSGHQPELFHSGVWFKNFVLDRIARENLGLGIHVLIDNDLLRQRGLTIPTGSRNQARRETIWFDDQVVAKPYEEATIHNRPLFQSFASRVAENIAPFVKQPIIERIWPAAVEAIDSGKSVGAALSEARHRLERDWGLETLEVPLSHICQSRVFRLFVVQLLTDAAQLHELYNHALLQYRRTHHIRSQSHPAPALTVDAEWLEMPFWIWDRSSAVRQALFVRHTDGRVQLRPGRSGQVLEGWALHNPSQAVRKLDELESVGTKIRPRALLTTMYTRVFLADLFLHGIGGAKYDELTDELIRQWWNVDPPGFMVVSATTRLPGARLLVGPDDIRQVEGLIRQLWFHPELCDPDLDQRDEFEMLVRQKHHLITHPPIDGSRKSWHDEVEVINGQLRRLLKSKFDDLLREKSRLEAQSHHDQHLMSREYSFAILPESRQKKTLLDLVANIA